MSSTVKFKCPVLEEHIACCPRGMPVFHCDNAVPHPQCRSYPNNYSQTRRVTELCVHSKCHQVCVRLSVCPKNWSAILTIFLFMPLCLGRGEGGNEFWKCTMSTTLLLLSLSPSPLSLSLSVWQMARGRAWSNSSGCDVLYCSDKSLQHPPTNTGDREVVDSQHHSITIETMFWGRIARNNFIGT